MMSGTAVRTWFMRTVFLLAAAAALVGGMPGLPPQGASAEAAVPSGPTYWGAYINGAPSNPALLDQFEATAGQKMSIVHWGQPWLNGGAYQSFQTDAFQTVRNRGEIPMLTWGSWSLGGGVNQPNFRTATIASGAYDSYIIQWAQAAKAWGQPFFLRFDHEMNGSWQFPWADQTNGNQAGDYVRAYQHVHDLFVQQGATNATWVWCPNISGTTTTPLGQLYPGDNYVDWTCLDGYNFGTDASGNAWQTFGQVFGGSTYGGYNPHNSYQELLQLAPSKPIMLGEVASAENGGSKAAWITDMLQTLPTNFPQVKAFVWNDWDEGSSAITWPIESSPAAEGAFASGLAGHSIGNQFASMAAAPIASPS